MPPDDTTTCTIFYSWQSQLPNSTNRSFIEDALERAAKAVRNDATIDARPEIDKDTVNVPGSPNIADTIRTKIDAAQVVICDVSIVQGRDGDGERVRPTPNPNVLIELGYAMKSLGTTERLLLVMNTAYGEISDLPFDLRQYRPTTYRLSESDDKAASRKELVSNLEKTFRHVLQGPSRHAKPAAQVEDRLKRSGNSGTIDFLRTLKPQQLVCAPYPRQPTSGQPGMLFLFQALRPEANALDLRHASNDSYNHPTGFQAGGANVPFTLSIEDVDAGFSDHSNRTIVRLKRNGWVAVQRSLPGPGLRELVEALA